MAKKREGIPLRRRKCTDEPIHGRDLAEICVNAIDMPHKEIEVGGPDIFTQKEIASLAFDVLGKESKITYIPDWIRVLILKISKLMTSSRVYGPIEFFLTVMSIDMIAAAYGKYTLKEYFDEISADG